MKRIFLLLLFNCLLGVIGFAQGSVVLDLSKGDGTKAFVLPRVATTTSIVTPLNGMLVYDISSDCMKIYQAGAWSACLGGGTTSASMTVNCAASVINGTYTQNVTLNSANTVTVVVVNNTSSTFTVTTSTADVLFSGTAAPGMSVSSVSPATVSPAINGGTSTITYTLSGTPTAYGAFTATWSKFSLTCAKSGTVGADNLRLALNAAGCTSCGAYDAAANDTWIPITAAEYAQIDNYMTVNLAAANEATMNTAYSPFGSNLALVTTSGHASLPANNYVVGFSCVIASGTSTGSYLKYSTAQQTGFNMSGPNLSITMPGASGRVYNILKRPSFVVNSSSASYVAMYIGNGPNLGYITGGTTYWNADASTINGTTGGYTLQFQVKGTATKKW